MKISLSILATVVVLSLAQFASADVIPGDQYYIAPVLSDAAFTNPQVPTPLTEVIFDIGGTGQTVPGFGSSTIDVSETVVTNANNTKTYRIRLLSSDNQLFPSGVPNTSVAGLAMGAPGGSPLTFDSPPVFVSPGGALSGARVEFQDSNGASIGSVVDISGDLNIVNNDVSFLVNLGSGLVGADVSTADVFLTIPVAIPEPSSAVLIGLGLIGAFVRRRR